MQLLTQNQRQLLALIFSATPTMDDAEDVLQEVNMALWKKRGSYDRDQAFLRWALGFAWVEIRRFRDRRPENQAWASDGVLESLAAVYPVDSRASEQRISALTGCVEKLGGVERQLITQFYSRQLSAREIADSTDRTVRNVYKILTKARRLLRECVDRSLAHQSRSV